MKKLHSTLMVVLMLEFIGFAVWWNYSKTRILVLHSYDTEYAWSKSIDEGIRRVLKPKADWSLRWHYMDTKRHPWDEYKRRAGTSVRRLMKDWKPALVIAIDDDAQKQVMKHYVNNDDVQVVYVGINGEIDRYGYAAARNVTGIVERVPWQALKELLQNSSLGQAKPDLRILHLGDTTGTVRQDAQYIREFDWAPLKLVGVRCVNTFDDWKSQIHKAHEEADVVLVSNYRRLEKGGARTERKDDKGEPTKDEAECTPVSGDDKSKSVDDKTELEDARDVVSWTEANAKIPTIGFKVTYGVDGGMLAVSASPYEQGTVAAQMALDILSGVPATQLPREATQQFVISMDSAKLKEREIDLPGFYKSFARALGTYQ
jgi:ABC-type uncharacterized transport system substrate-binding protein